MGHFGTRDTDRVSGHPPLHFDLSTFDIYGTYAAGAELHLVPASAEPEPARAGRVHPRLGADAVVLGALGADLHGQVRRRAEQDDFPALERLLWCGEVLPTPVLAHWMRRLPHVRFTNLYGPTEATIASSFYDVPGVPEDETPADPDRRPRATARSCSCSTSTSRRSRPARSVTSSSAGPA